MTQTTRNALFSLHSMLVAALVVTAVVSGGCAPKEELRPLYQPEPLVFEESFTAHISTDIPMTVIEPNFLQRVAGTLFGWIPVVGQLLELPVNILSAIVPSLEDVSHPELPKDSRLSDPQILSRLQEVVIRSGHLNIVPENQRGSGYKPETCWFRKCPEIGFSFLDEIRIYMIFARPEPRAEGGVEKLPVLIASAEKSDYDPRLQILPFTMTRVNLKPLFERYPNYSAEVVATGRLPKRNVYVSGGFLIDASFSIR